MGADMVGVLLKGPKEITEEQANSAARAILDAAEERRASGKIICPDCDEVFEPGGAEDNDGVCPNCSQDIGDPLIDITTLEEARAYVDKLASGWPPDYRDIASRCDPDDQTQVLVFAGEMTWGDEPDGAGYQYLKELVLSGVAANLGIR